MFGSSVNLQASRIPMTECVHAHHGYMRRDRLRQTEIWYTKNKNGRYWIPPSMVYNYMQKVEDLCGGRVNSGEINCQREQAWEPNLCCEVEKYDQVHNTYLRNFTFVCVCVQKSNNLHSVFPETEMFKTNKTPTVHMSNADSYIIYQKKGSCYCR